MYVYVYIPYIPNSCCAKPLPPAGETPPAPAAACTSAAPCNPHEQGSSAEDVLSRILIVPRQPDSDHFLNLYSCIDVALHPFPFDGSKTAADALALGIPAVTLPTQQLKARMAASFARSLKLDELIANNVTDYIRIAVQLARDPAFLQEMTAKVVARGQFAFDDPIVALEWQLWLMNAVAWQDSDDDNDDGAGGERVRMRQQLEALQAAADERRRTWE